MKHIYINAVCLLLFSLIFSACDKSVNPNQTVDQQPKIFPDYSGVVFPANIAPPNFAIEEKGESYLVEIGQEGNKPVMQYKSAKPEVYISAGSWEKLLKQASGANIYFRIYIEQNKSWIKYADITNTISTESIDRYLVYRLLYPGYELWNEMGIYQRDLTSYKQTAIVENSSLERGCVNCHTFANNSPNTMLLHIRGKNGGTVIMRDGKTTKTDMKIEDMKNRGTYASWHPSGKYVAFSMNDVRQFFHLTGKKPIEVMDRESDLAIYDCDEDKIFTAPEVSGKEFMETFPSWAPDGKTLYFCRTDALKDSTILDSIHYDLYKVSFNPETKQIGSPVCIYKASDLKKSVSFPRVSPDGRYLLFTQSNYGNFSIWHPESDLYIIDLTNNQVRCLDEVNSGDVESFHTWSSTGRWFVFSSKRMDGLWARPHFASFDPVTGKASKPFVLPQSEPYFYTEFNKTYNLPELITEPIKNKRSIK